MTDFASALERWVAAVSGVLTDYVMVILLLGCAFWFTFMLRGVQFRMLPEMLRLLMRSGKSENHLPEGEKPQGRTVSSFQAFALSIASRVGTGNLAGVATAIAIGGPGAVFWMWIIALVGASSAFVESTLAQLFKVRGRGSFVGGPAYYISKGLHCRPWAVIFAILITLTFGFAFNSVQANTISSSLGNSFGIPAGATAVVLALFTLVIISGGVTWITRFSEIVVPVMAVAYIILAAVIIGLNIHRFPEIISLIVRCAFGLDSAFGATVGSAMILGVKRGLFSNEAGEGSTPNAAATASVSHPVKQGLIQALGVYTDTLVVCTATAFIILVSGIYAGAEESGIVLTQNAIDAGLGGSHRLGSTFVAIAVFFFAFTSIVANYYYGEANLRFIRDSKAVIIVYRLAVAVTVLFGSVMSLELVWGFADITMALMTICNLAAILLLGRYVRVLLRDYRTQRREGRNPVYSSETLPEISSETECWK